jgi:hypothetical protein
MVAAALAGYATASMAAGIVVYGFVDLTTLTKVIGPAPDGVGVSLTVNPSGYYVFTFDKALPAKPIIIVTPLTTAGVGISPVILPLTDTQHFTIEMQTAAGVKSSRNSSFYSWF